MRSVRLACRAPRDFGHRLSSERLRNSLSSTYVCARDSKSLEQGDPMSHRKNLIVGLGIALLTLLGSVSVAEAQGYPPPYYPPPPPPPPPHGVYRAGLVFGFSGGIGGVAASNCGDECGVAGSLEGHLGGMIGPRTALLFEIWGNDHPWTDSAGNSRETINTFFTGALQYWLTDILWVKGGAGFAE